MKGHGSKIFIALAVAVIAFALWDFERSKVEESDALVANRIFPNRLQEEVEEFKIHSIFGDISLQMRDGKWKMTTPVQDSADLAAVSTYLNTLLNQETKKVERETGSEVDWSQYGLDKPDGWVEVGFADKTRSLVQVGTVRAVANGHYLRKDQGPELLVGTSDWTSIVNRPAGEFRNQSMFDLDGDLIEFGIVNKLASSKSPKRLDGRLDAGQWTLLNTDKSATFDQAKLKDFIALIGNFKIDLVVADSIENKSHYGLDKPVVEVFVKSAQEERQISFGKGKNGKFYVTSTARAGVFEVSEAKVNTLIKTPEDFKADKAPEKALNTETVNEQKATN